MEGATVACLFPFLPHMLYPKTKGLRLKSQLHVVPVPDCMGDATQSDSAGVGGCKGLKSTSLSDYERCRFLRCVHAVVMLPQLPSSKLNLQYGRKASDGLCTVSIAGDLLAHHPARHWAGWHQCALGGNSCMYKPQLNFLLSITLPFSCVRRNCFPLAAPTTDFASSFSVQQENAIRTEDCVQKKMSDRPATSMHDILLGQASVKHSLSKLAIQ